MELDLKSVVKEAVKKAEAKQEIVTLTAKIDEAFEDIEAAVSSKRVTIKDLAELAGIDVKVFTETLRQVRRKRAGLTRAGKPRTRGPRLTGTPAPAVAPATLSPRPTFQPPATPAASAPNPLAPRPANPVAEALAAGGVTPPEKKRYMSPLARERFAERKNVTGMDQALIDQAKAEQQAIAEGRRADVEIGGFKK